MVYFDLAEPTVDYHGFLYALSILLISILIQFTETLVILTLYRALSLWPTMLTTSRGSDLMSKIRRS